MKKLLVIVATITSLNAFSMDDFGFTLNKKYEIYNIYGKNGDELDRSFENQRPKALTDQGFDALTKWKYDLSYDNRDCEIINYSVDIKYVLPNIDTSELSDDLKSEVYDFNRKMFAHEEYHCAIVSKYMNDIYNSLKKGQKSDCHSHIREIDTLVNETNKANDLFDKATNHGDVDVDVDPIYENYLEMCKISMPDS